MLDKGKTKEERMKRSIALIVLAMIGAGLAQTWQAGPTTGFTYWRFDGEYFPGTNKVYFLGGRLADGTTSGAIWSYDPVARTYAATGATMPTPISNYDICLLRDNYDLPSGDTYGLYVFGGRTNAAAFVCTVQAYYPRTNRVRLITTDTFPGKVGSPGQSYVPGGAIALNNKAYVWAGFTSLIVPYMSNQTWVFSPLAPAGTRWTQLLNLPLVRAYPLTATIDSFVYSMGGDTFDGASLYAETQCWRLDTRSPGSGWTAIASLPQICGEARAFGFDSVSPYGYNRSIITAGRGFWPDEDSISFIFKADSNVWRSFPNLLRGRRNHAGAMIPGMGSTNGVPGLWVWGGRYDTDTQIWNTSEFWQLTWVITHDVGCACVTAPSGALDSNTAVTPACTVYNAGNQTETFTVRMKIGATYNNTATVGPLAPPARAYVTFPIWPAAPRGIIAVSCSTELTGDIAPANDKATGSVTVGVLDAEVLGIIGPTDGNIDSGATVTPSATIRNNGTASATFNARFDIGTTWTSTKPITLAAGASQPLSFDSWTATQRGTFGTKCTTLLGGDMVPANDFKTGSVNVAVHDVGAVQILVPSGAISPGPIDPQAKVHNYGTAREAVRVAFTINAIPSYQDVADLPLGLPLNADTAIQFAPWTATTGVFTARCSTYLANDQRHVNDTISTGFEVGNVDVAVIQINAPTGDHDTSAAIVPSAKFRNTGDFTASFNTFFWFGSYSESIPIANLPSTRETTLVFPAWAKPHPVATYVTRCSTYLAGDGDLSNNALGGSFRITAAAPPPPSETGWVAKADVPVGPKSKRVKDGGALAYSAESTDAAGFIYAFKGNNRCEFYKYNTTTNTWAAKESIPAIGSSGKKKAVKKGGSLAHASGKIYATKGNNTIEFWEYTPSADAYPWTEKAPVPSGAKNVKEGTGAAAVTINDSTYIYLLKGSGTQEFYRYNTATNTWASLAGAPLGTSGKTWKNGSCIALDPDQLVIYALKASYNELFAYNCSTNTWTTKKVLPFIGTSGKKKKVKDGAGLAFSDGKVYALKGGNTQEFWRYAAATDTWKQFPDIPIGMGKRVKGGGALVTAGDDVLYALKGNNTLEFWKYGIAPASFPVTGYGPNALANSTFDTPHYALRITPNPFSNTTFISYSLARAGSVTLGLYDVTGSLVTTLNQGYRAAGSYTTMIDATRLARGIYVLKLEAENASATSKLIIE
jgi:hypothetical protein